MLTSKNKALLLSLANPLEPSLTIGKGEVDAKVLAVIDKALTAHELIKIKVLVSQKEELAPLGEAIAAKTSSELVQAIGRILILYRTRKEHPSIVL
jgi:RNA-binding protein